MRLVLDLPEWCDERHIYIMAGIELVAYKQFGEDVIHIKDARCDMCGKCCEGLPLSWPFSDGQHGCVFLKDEPGPGNKKRCELGSARPLCCSTGEPKLNKMKGAEEFCSITYRTERVG